MIGEMRTAFWLLCLGILLAIQYGDAERKIVCYYTNWSVYRPGTAKFSPQNINPYLCTHLIYAFGGFTKDNTLKPFDKYQDIEKGGYAKFNGLKSYNKNLKTMLAIGGWNEGSSRFSPMVADAERRREFVKNSVKFLRQNHFDGLDLDWEYPAFRDGGKPRDKDNYANLVQELREEFERESSKTGRPRLLLSMAMPAGAEYIDKGYDIPRLNEYLDFINLLSYDYHSAYEPAVNHHSPLYPLEEDNEYNYDTELTIDYSINHLVERGASPEKIILGIPTYGRSYTLFNEDSTDLGAPADGPGEEGDATREKGYLAYYEICESISSSDDWEVVQPNPKAMGPYAFKGNQWVGYDDEDIVKLKARYVNEKNLGGIMFWSIDNDDFRGKCHGRPYPLIEAAKEAMLSESSTRPKSKTGDSRKKIRNQGIQSNAIGRKLGTNRRTTTTTAAPITRKRTTSRTKYRTISRPRYSEEDDAEDRSVDRRSFSASIEDEEAEGGNIVRTVEKPERSRPKTRSGSRTRPSTRRRKIQRKENKEAKDEVNLSNKLTTPEPPTTPDPGTDFKCEDEGFFPHPRDCKKYFWCLDSGPGGLGVVAHQFTCPSGLVFNKAADSCDYPRNVVCPKSKTQSTVSTTRAPITAATSRTTYLHTSTRRTTTVEPEPEEEYEYYDEEEESEEEDAVDEKEEQQVTSTAKPLQYKTINRSRPTTTTTTTTTTTAKPEKIESDLEEDPKVIKELIDLIRKAGGIEQLEKQLLLQDKSSDTTSGGENVTPAAISRSLYERVLNRQSNRKNASRQSSTTSGKSSYENGPGRAQFEGLENIPEVKNLRRNQKPQYVTIERPRPANREQPDDDDEEDDDELEDEPESDTSEEHSFNNPAATSSSTQRVTPNYVNIRRNRLSSTTSKGENDVVEKDEEAEDERPIRRRRPTFPKNRDEEGSKQVRIRGSTIRNTETPDVANADSEEKLSKKTRPSNDEDSPTTKSRYINIQRFRSTTTSSDQSEDSNALEPTTEPITTAMPEKPEETTLTPSTTTPNPPTTTQASSTAQESTESPTLIVTSTEAVKLVEDSATEILLTTAPASSTQSGSTSSTTARLTVATVSQPRPFGFSRRNKPEVTTSSPPLSASTTEQRSKVSITPRNFAFLVGRGRLRQRTDVAEERRTTSAYTRSTAAIDEEKRDQPEVGQRTRSRYRGTSKYTPPTARPKGDEAREGLVRGRSRTRQASLTTTLAPTLTTTASPATPVTPATAPRSDRRKFRRPNGRTVQNLNVDAAKANELEDSPIIRIQQGPKRFSAQRSRSNANDEQKEEKEKEKITNIRVFKRPGSVNRDLYDRSRFNKKKSEDAEANSVPLNEVQEVGLGRKSDETLIATATSSSLLQRRGEGSSTRPPAAERLSSLAEQLSADADRRSSLAGQVSTEANPVPSPVGQVSTEANPVFSPVDQLSTVASPLSTDTDSLSTIIDENEIQGSVRTTTEHQNTAFNPDPTSGWTTAGYTFATETVTESPAPGTTSDDYESTVYEMGMTNDDTAFNTEVTSTSANTEPDDYFSTRNLVENPEVEDADQKTAEGVTEAVADRSAGPRRRKVLVRRRPVTAGSEAVTDTLTTTPMVPTTMLSNPEVSSPEPSTAEKDEEAKRPVRRRKVIRRLRPVQNAESVPEEKKEAESTTENLKSISDNLLDAFTSVTEVPTEVTTTKDFDFYSTRSPTLDESKNTDAVSTTESSLTTDSLTTETNLFTLTTLPRSTELNPTESTLNEETTQTPSTEVQNSTSPVNSLNSRRGSDSRYIRKKFIRKRPVSSAENVSTPSFRNSPSTTGRNLEALSKRRKSLFIRRRPVSSTTTRTTQALDDFLGEDEDFEEEEEEEDPYDVENQQIADDTKISPVENESILNFSVVKSADEFWRHYTTASTPSSILNAHVTDEPKLSSPDRDYLEDPEESEVNQDGEEFDDEEKVEEPQISKITRKPELRPRYKVPDSLRRLATASTEATSTVGRRFTADSAPEESEEYPETNDGRPRYLTYRQPRTRYKQNETKTETTTTPKITTQYTEYFTLTEPTLKGRLNSKNQGVTEAGITETDIPVTTEFTTLLRSRFLPRRPVETTDTTEGTTLMSTDPVSLFRTRLDVKPTEVTEPGITETEIPPNTESVSSFRTRYLSRNLIESTEPTLPETDVPQTTEYSITSGIRNRYLPRRITEPETTESTFAHTEPYSITSGLRSRYLSRKPTEPETTSSLTSTTASVTPSLRPRYLTRRPISDPPGTETPSSTTEFFRPTSRLRFYTKRPPSSTEATVTETLIPAKKFDYVADAHHRRQQSLRTTARPKSNSTETTLKSPDENPEENFVDDKFSSDFTTSKPTKPQVTRLVTSVAESGTTERQKILIKTKYSSLTATTRIPVQNGGRLSYPPTTPSGFDTLEKSSDSKEADDESINEIRQGVERSTLPIESEFSHRGRRRFTTESYESSTIEIESVFSNLIREARNYGRN